MESNIKYSVIEDYEGLWLSEVSVDEVEDYILCDEHEVIGITNSLADAESLLAREYDLRGE